MEKRKGLPGISLLVCWNLEKFCGGGSLFAFSQLSFLNYNNWQSFEVYNQRGIIPRVVEHLFDAVNQEIAASFDENGDPTLEYEVCLLYCLFFFFH